MRAFTFFVFLSLFSVSSFGQISTDSIVKTDSLTSVFTDTSKLYILSMLDVSPQFNNGQNDLNKYLSDYLYGIQKPNAYRVTGSSFRIEINFIVEKDGSISMIRLSPNANELDFDTRRRIIDVFEKMPKWKPGYYLGKPVRCSLALPIALN